ncbi:hypothetical protein SAMN05421819_0534 [Bryocella elongata]|uniref:Uncharacterized protein n=1 Tax=Bryocella elongata TaxID=863522 RepID=A0A1H5TA25_9BACT|nr:hypothetical protein [Bryocella elongata]SEF59675.1 hypothetical protein SAMN05421819_0534 [Bryocella elongata]
MTIITQHRTAVTHRTRMTTATPIVAPAPFVVQPARRRLVRKFVATGDALCPLIGLWTAVPETDATTDEPGLRWPVRRTLLRDSPFGRALHRTFAIAC